MKITPITENHLYQKAYAKGKRYVTPAVAVYVLPDYKARELQKAHPKRIKVNRVGLTVSKKIGGAVVRSRVRRILREAYRHIEAKRPLKKGFLLVFAAREPSASMKSTEMASQLGYALKRLEMYEA